LAKLGRANADQSKKEKKERKKMRPWRFGKLLDLRERGLGKSGEPELFLGGGASSTAFSKNSSTKLFGKSPDLPLVFDPRHHPSVSSPVITNMSPCNTADSIL